MPTQRFVYDEAGQLLGEYGSLPREYIWMDSLPVGALDGTSPIFVVADGLGTPRRVDAGDGSGMFWQWLPTANPFGERAFTGNYMFNLRFPGQYFDVETGLIYSDHRYYHPGTGRYLQSDSIGLAGGLSTYGYVACNPLGAVDPQGLAQQRYRADDNVVETPQMKAAYNRLTDLATQAANTVDATCGARCLLPWIRGTLIHSEFKRLVDTQCPQSMYHTEVTYKDGVVERYGLPGSSRADVVFGPQQQPIAVFDLKTGRAYITISQGNAYGANLPVGTPISEIHPVEP